MKHHFKVKLFGSSLPRRVSLFLFCIITFSKLSHGATVETTKISSLLADTVNHLIEKIQDDQQADQSSFPQTRGGGGGYGHGHGGGSHGNGAITLDPVSIISLLALGAFLINNILQLLRTNMGNNAGAGGGGRSLPMINLDKISWASPARNGLNEEEPSFIDFFENVGSLYYMQPKKRQICMKRVVCNYINLKESRENNPTDMKSKIFDFMLSTVTKLVAPELDDKDKEERCMKAHKLCSDSLLKDARVSVEYKIYSQVSSWITKLAFNGIASG